MQEIFDQIYCILQLRNLNAQDSLYFYLFHQIMPYQTLQPRILSLLSDPTNPIKMRLKNVCSLLEEAIPHYDWVGFYFANHEERTLHLKAFAGELTDHTVIPFGKGICGQVAVSNTNFIVPDVREQSNYIACSIDVLSEIVIPVFKDGHNVGQIDIDSHTRDAFSEEDEIFLEWVTQEVAKQLTIDSVGHVDFL